MQEQGFVQTSSSMNAMRFVMGRSAPNRTEGLAVIIIIGVSSVAVTSNELAADTTVGAIK